MKLTDALKKQGIESHTVGLFGNEFYEADQLEQFEINGELKKSREAE